ncbi:HAD family hydrolase [Puniceibacterium sediminis]|uniref:Haloacid dehalogenase superfamily, subfamily IA, variant 3 with third motif having DD or ED n=1 Tax=Puniceibacterium sediminis TaxID=1608407 RepID=A0A238YUD5_9RHOB|nr:HAD-IA family hydrolase [Puniceibacterium sediminis]SNR74398.1 haloacid dehalogenase superfamily, subfamily IA, variant 3 with third motif having DD or ED [Puniceibacterium sediminis]
MVSFDELVIFDCDGVLVDSELLTMAVLSEQIPGLDAMTAYNRFRGRKISDCLRELETEFDFCLSAEFIENFRNACADRYRAELKCDPDLRGVVDGLDGRYCVGTSAPFEKVKTMLGAVGVWDLFEWRIFSAYALKTWKPAPDLFLTAARHWGAEPCNCLVVEDSPTGVAAARNAGMYTVVLDPRGEATGPEFAGTQRITRIADLPAQIAMWREKRRSSRPERIHKEFVSI